MRPAASGRTEGLTNGTLEGQTPLSAEARPTVAIRSAAATLTARERAALLSPYRVLAGDNMGTLSAFRSCRRSAPELVASRRETVLRSEGRCRADDLTGHRR